MNRLHFRDLLSVACTLMMVVSLMSKPPVEAAAPPAGGGGALADECNKEFEKLTICLDFASGKLAKPTKKCCETVEGIKENDPKCLCFIIQQAKKGGQAMKQLGVQEDKLLQLPSACQLRNASIANCPSLLGLPPGSPDAAIFTGNATTASPQSQNKSPASSSSAQKGGSASISDKQVAIVVVLAMVVISAISGALGLA